MKLNPPIASSATQAFLRGAYQGITGDTSRLQGIRETLETSYLKPVVFPYPQPSDNQSSRSESNKAESN